MASLSLLGVVQHLEEIFAQVDWAAVSALASGGRQPPDGVVRGRGEEKNQGADAPRSPDPLDDIEIPEV
jgi:hypothetical protein